MEIRQKRDQLSLIGDSMGSAAVAIRGGPDKFYTALNFETHERHCEERQRRGNLLVVRGSGDCFVLRNDSMSRTFLE